MLGWIRQKPKSIYTGLLLVSGDHIGQGFEVSILANQGGDPRAIQLSAHCVVHFSEIGAGRPAP